MTRLDLDAREEYHRKRARLLYDKAAHHVLSDQGTCVVLGAAPSCEGLASGEFITSLTSAVNAIAPN